MKTGFRKFALIISALLLLESSYESFTFAVDVFDAADHEPAENKENMQYGNDVFDAEDTEEEPEVKEDETDAENTDIILNADPSESGQDDTSDDPEEPEDPPEPEPEVKNGWVTENGGKYYYIEGTAVTGMQKIGNYWYFFSKTGVMKTGWRKIDGSRYYFSPKTGRRVHGKQVIDGSTYYFRTNGKMAVGWLKVKGKKYYHKKSGERVFGFRKIGKYRYYFKKKSGIMKKGWLKYKKKYYYFNKKGRKLFGVQKIGGKTYYLNDTTGVRMSKSKYGLYSKIWTRSSSTPYLIYVDKDGKWVNVFKGRARSWTIKKRFRCSIGSSSTPTPSGSFRATCKVYHFGEGKGYTCWYATGFIGSAYLMHSVVCYRGTKRPSDGRLGMSISHGCIRMKLSSAKWIYDNIPVGSTVIIS